MKYYRLLSMVPPLPEVPGPPPVPLGELIELYQQELDEKDQRLALALLAFLDCRNLESALLGREMFDTRAPLPREAFEDRLQLPEYMARFLEAHDNDALGHTYPFDALWWGYFVHLVELADSSGSVFLKEWVRFDVGLRDALARQRAEALGAKGDERATGAVDGEAESFAELLSALPEASDPMERERVLDRARLERIDACQGISTFSTDAALAYLAASMILDRWSLEEAADMSKMLEVIA